MKKTQTGVFSTRYDFTLAERERYEQYKARFDGFYTEIFVNNGYCIEVTKRVMK